METKLPDKDNMLEFGCILINETKKTVRLKFKEWSVKTYNLDQLPHIYYGVLALFHSPAREKHNPMYYLAVLKETPNNLTSSYTASQYLKDLEAFRNEYEGRYIMPNSLEENPTYMFPSTEKITFKETSKD